MKETRGAIKFFILLFIIVCLALICVGIIDKYVFSDVIIRYSEIFRNLLTAVVSLMVGTAITYFSKLFSQTPSTLNISVLGYPYSGKTVYLTVLFNDLMTNQYQDGISFRTYGSETIERISTDYQLLSKGQWLPPTPNEGVFYYRATISLSIFKNYKLEVGDYAGEKFKKELQANNNFFHKTEYFKYVVTSDIVFLAVDLDKVIENLKNNVDYITGVESSFIAALNLMQENKNLGFNSQIKFPVALLFLKADLMEMEKENINDSRIIREFDRLIGFCKKNCLNFKCFFVSSTGTGDLGERMHYKMFPQGVIEPIIWSIKKYHS